MRLKHMQHEPNANQAIVSIQEATKAFSEIVTFQGLNLAIRKNEVLCIVGPSGCGKTTLLRSINGLCHLTSGKIVFHGKVVSEPDPRMAMVFQQFGLFPWKTVWHNVAYPLSLRKMAKNEVKERVENYLKMVGLEAFAHKYPYQLSGGMQQRVGLARALATHPELMLMDEPFASVDAQTREVLQMELLSITEKQTQTMIFITHSIDEAIVLGDRIAVMSHRPSRILEVIDVEIPKPREISAVKSLPYYSGLRNHIWELLMHQGRRAQKEVPESIGMAT